MTGLVLRRKGSVAVIAALAIGAVVGGASGAGVAVLVAATGAPSIHQAQGASGVTINNPKDVTSVAAAAAAASPSVVTIDVSSGGKGGVGSGVILSADGYVLTNRHVVTLDGAVTNATLRVKASDGTLYTATVVGTDAVSDLAVIKLSGAQGLSPITWADSSALNVGDTVIAIGSPLDLSGTVTDGIVSALNRSIAVGPSSPMPVIQTDAAINPGNSGGALLNQYGQLIGINVAIAGAGGSSSSTAASGSIGVGFSIPSNLAKRVSDELIASGTATHGMLRASVKDSTTGTVGAVVGQISAGGAAETAGLQPGDVVVTFNGVPITDAKDLTAQVRVLAAGGKADLTYLRNGVSSTVSVTVGQLAS
jgi:putative serine protease PepD